MRDDNTNTTNSPPAGFNRPVAGTIASIKGSSFTVKETTFNGTTATTDVATTSKTTFRQLVSGALSDLQVGDTVSVTGTTTDSVYTATRISETGAQTGVFSAGSGGPPQGSAGGGPQFFRNGGGDMRIGKITKVEGDTVTLAALDGTTVTVKTTPSTTVRVNKTIALRNLKVGDNVRVTGTASGSKVTADEVTKGADDALVP
jgi:uncharacterized protein DUF5666